jgi:hypothetical protein
MEKSDGLGTTKLGAKSGDGYAGKAQSEGDVNGFQSGQSPDSGDGAGKGVGKEQGFAQK